MPANVHPEYVAAEKKYLAAKTDEDKLLALEEMMKTMPKHKSAEAMRANIRTRYKKLKEKIETQKKKGKGKGKPGIKKEDLQATLVGLTNSGKSSILNVLTNCNPKISPIPYTTKSPNIGMLNYGGVQIQIIDLPAIESEYFDQGVANSTDLLIIVIENTSNIDQVSQFLTKALGKRLVVLNKIDLLHHNEKRKIQAWLQSKRYDFQMISCKTQEGILELKEKIFKSFDIIRVYTKEPRKSPSPNPIVLAKDSSVKDVADKIRTGMSEKIREARVTGPSSKFPNQKVGINHILKDKDIVEFYFD